MTKTPRRPGYTLLELLVAMAIVAILAVVTYQSSAGVFRQSNVVGQMTVLKSAVVQARARALEQTAPAKIDLAGGRILTALDIDDSGSFGDSPEEVVVGDATGVGIQLDIKYVTMIPPGDAVIGGLVDHPSGAYKLNDVIGGSFSTFTNDDFYVMPTGLVYDEPGSNNPSGGTIFLRSADSQLVTLVHITGLGEVRTAIRNVNETGWTWQ